MLFLQATPKPSSSPWGRPRPWPWRPWMCSCSQRWWRGWNRSSPRPNWRMRRCWVGCEHFKTPVLLNKLVSGGGAVVVRMPFYSSSFSDLNRNKLLSVIFAEIKHQTHIWVLILLDHQKFLLTALIITVNWCGSRLPPVNPLTEWMKKKWNSPACARTRLSDSSSSSCPLKLWYKSKIFLHHIK